MLKDFKNNNDVILSFFIHEHVMIPSYLKNKNIICSCGCKGIVEFNQIKSNYNAEFFLSNWPVLIVQSKKYPNANYVINNYVNIPLWNKQLYD